MGTLIHLLQGLVVACIAYVGFLVLGIIAGGILIICLLNKIVRSTIGKAMWVLLLGMVLLPAPRTVYASSVHISRKQYVKEVTGIVNQYSVEVANYAGNPPDGVTEGAVSAYVTRAEWDISLVAAQLIRYKHHRNIAREDVESVLSQLSRDVEDTPEPITSSTDLKN